MILLLVGLGLTVCMVYIIRLLIPAYLLLNLYFPLLMRTRSDEDPIIRRSSHSFFEVLCRDAQRLSALTGTVTEFDVHKADGGAGRSVLTPGIPAAERLPGGRAGRNAPVAALQSGRFF